ncbi:putative Mak16-like RNA binding protein [Spironucleus salmonicida]|uniref:Protein MAK16 homolog n=1 Tax=Spironucleus salmonicida TaxID=348837 RepID=V6LS23_9EUKA|nr:putative Mak16-like RNA binding protein [Spironucleus salmonicida]|eukprot:EST43579.1 Putative Mak16-like RNA binding protein [Spironucleus salmonicida]
MLYDSKDSLIWSCIGKGGCAHALKTDHKKTYCKSEYNVSGLCDQQYCPLANAQYATLKEEDDRLYLLVKVIERQHLPATQWERIELPLNYEDALYTIRQKLQYWDTDLVKKCILRLTKFNEEFSRRKSLGMKIKSRTVSTRMKQERRERIRQAKALKAAHIERTVEKELMKQLQLGKYDGIFDVARFRHSQEDMEDMLDEHEAEYEVVNIKENQI